MKRPPIAPLCAALAGLLLLLSMKTSSGAPGDLYAVGGEKGYTDDAIFRFTPNGTRTTFTSLIHQPVAMAFDRKGNLFVADSGSGIPQGPSSILRFTPDGIRTTFVSLGFANPLGMTFDGTG